jgi:hypothetical protein
MLVQKIAPNLKLEVLSQSESAEIPVEKPILLLIFFILFSHYSK